IYKMAAAPAAWVHDASTAFAQRSALIDENRQLRETLMLAEARLNRMNAVAHQNERLKQLLDTQHLLGMHAQLAHLIDVQLGPTRDHVMLNVGADEGVHVGQVVIDSHGVMGQVIETLPHASVAMLVGDPGDARAQWLARHRAWHRRPRPVGGAEPAVVVGHQTRRPVGDLRPRRTLPRGLSGGDRREAGPRTFRHVPRSPGEAGGGTATQRRSFAAAGPARSGRAAGAGAGSGTAVIARARDRTSRGHRYKRPASPSPACGGRCPKGEWGKSGEAFPPPGAARPAFRAASPASGGGRRARST